MKIDGTKSSGISNIRTSTLRDCLLAKPGLAVRMINTSLSTMQIPDVWKTGTIIPLPKSGSLVKVSNWRPICLLNCVSKIAEKTVHKQLLDYMIANNIIADEQAGFVPGRSTGDSIFGLVNHLYSAMNKQERSAVVFLDLRKAFDTVDHSILLQKLRHYGIDDASRGWFQNYLDSRLQQTRANDMTSSLQEVRMGVPQGSVLGPLLFIVYMNDVINSITHSSTFLYADDLAIVISGKDPERVKSLLQLDLDSVSRWCSDNKLTINNDKTHVLWVFSPRSIPDLSNCDLTIDGRVLSVVPVFNYLGLNIDRHLNMASQLKKQIRLLRMRLPQLRFI